MLHAHLTTLNAVSLVLDTFKAQGLPSEALLAGSGICAADLMRRRLTVFLMVIASRALSHCTPEGMGGCCWVILCTLSMES